MALRELLFQSKHSEFHPVLMIRVVIIAYIISFITGTADIRVTAHFEEAKCSLILEKITPGCYTKKQLPDDESLTIDETLQSFNLTLESVEVCYNCGYGLYVTTAIMLPFLLLLGNL